MGDVRSQRGARTLVKSGVSTTLIHGEVTVVTRRRATPSRRASWLLWLIGCWAGAVGCTDICLLNGECAGEQICLDGACRVPCVADRACAAGEFCLEGGCRGLRPGEAPPCRDDAGCPDVGADGGEEADAAGDGEVVDRGVRDAAPVGPDTAGDAGADAEPDAGPDGGADAEPDGAADDAAAEDATFDDAAADAAPAGDGALDAAASDAALDGLDLGGLYAVTTTVVFATGGALGEGEVTHHIHRLVALGGARYRVEVFDEAGAPEHVAEADFTAPEGEGRYQFEYAIPVEAPAGCAGSETRFQRGAVVAEAPGRRLDGAEERAVTFDGEGCPAGWLVRVDVRWTPLPDPE